MNLDWMGTLPSRIAYKSRVPSNLGSSRPEKDWSIQSKRRKDKFQGQVVYQENLHHFMSTGATEKLKSLQ